MHTPFQSFVPRVLLVGSLTALCACQSSHHRSATALVGKELTASIEDQDSSGTRVRVKAAAHGASDAGPRLMTLQAFSDRNGNLSLDAGEELGQPMSVGNGKTMSPLLETDEFELPRTSDSAPMLLEIEVAGTGSTNRWIVWRDPQSRFWKLMGSDHPTLGESGR